MKHYAEIIDKGECRSTLSFPINGKMANRDGWSKHNFYPQNGQVGELIESHMGNLEHIVNMGIFTVSTFILKINEDIYVPITDKGIKRISEHEYNLKKENNSFTCSMNKKQQSINEQYDRAINNLKKDKNMEIKLYGYRNLQDVQYRYKRELISINPMSVLSARDVLLTNGMKFTEVELLDNTIYYLECSQFEFTLKMRQFGF